MKLPLPPWRLPGFLPSSGENQSEAGKLSEAKAESATARDARVAAGSPSPSIAQANTAFDRLVVRRRLMAVVAGPEVHPKGWRPSQLTEPVDAQSGQTHPERTHLATESR